MQKKNRSYRITEILIIIRPKDISGLLIKEDILFSVTLCSSVPSHE